MIRDQRWGFNEIENGVDVRVGGRGGATLGNGERRVVFILECDR